MFREVVAKIQEKTKEGRELSYTDGAIGITALLHCPIKWELSKKYEITPEAVEIDDGFVWEKQVKEALRELYGEKFKEEYDLIVQLGGYKLHGHLDCLVELEDKVIGIELKAPKTLLLKSPVEENGVLFYDDGRVIHNEVYLKQARIEKALLELLFPDKPVEMYLFYKSLCKSGLWNRKLYVVSEVKESMPIEEIEELLRKFHEDKSPRYPNECVSYCVFYKEGLCEGKAFEGKEKEEEVKRFLDLLKHYRALQSDLKTIESQMKKMIKGSIKIGGREIGWVRRRTVEIDTKKLIELLPNAHEYLSVHWTKKEELLNVFGDEIVKRVKETTEWRL